MKYAIATALLVGSLSSSFAADPPKAMTNMDATGKFVSIGSAAVGEVPVLWCPMAAPHLVLMATPAIDHKARLQIQCVNDAGIISGTHEKSAGYTPKSN